MRWSVLAFAIPTFAVLSASERPARACECAPFDEAAATERHALVFDGWVIEAPQPWHCALPPAPRPRSGCIRVAVVSRGDCRASGDLLGLRTLDGTPVALTTTSIQKDATTFCGVAPGRYLLSGSPMWVGGRENGTLDYGRTIDVVPGGSYVVFAPSGVGQRLRVGAFRTLKGQPPREVSVTTERDCGTPLFEQGGAYRFFAEAGPNDTFIVKGCSAARELTEAERAETLAPPAAPAAPTARTPPPPSPSPPATTSSRGSCSAAGSAPGLASLALLCCFLLRRRRCGCAARVLPRPRSGSATSRRTSSRSCSSHSASSARSFRSSRPCSPIRRSTRAIARE